MFWKEYGKLIRRLWLNLFGAAVFGFMLSSISTLLAKNHPGMAVLIYVLSGVIGTVFYAYLLYLVIWEAGAKDRIRVDGGRISPRPRMGLKVALIFSLPMLIPGALYFVLSVLREYAGVDVGFLNAVSDVSTLIAYILSMPYVGFALALFGQLGAHIAEAGQTVPYSLYMLATVLPGFIVVSLGYYFGYQGKFMSRMMKPKKKD